MKKIFLQLLAILCVLTLSNNAVLAQGDTCGEATQICGSAPPFAANTTGGTAVGSVGVVGCLLQTPNETWFFFEVATAGTIAGSITNSAGLDVDGAIFGPFATQAAACAGLTAANLVACDYTGAATVPFNYAGAPGVYVVLITNFDGLPTNISFNVSTGNSNICCLDVTADQKICTGGAVATLNGTTVNPGGGCPPVVSTTTASPTTPGTTGSYSTLVTSSVNGTVNIAGIPAGATITNIAYSILGGIVNGSYCEEVRINVTAPTATYNLVGGALIGSTGLCTLAALSGVGGWSGTSTANANGAYTFSFFESFNDAGNSQDFSVTQLQVSVTYVVGAAPAFTWFNVPTGGTALGTGSTFNPVGADPALLNTNTPGIYTYYMGCGTTGCRPSAAITIVEPTPTNVCIGGGAATFAKAPAATAGTWTVSGGGTIVAATGAFSPTTAGCFSASFTPTGGTACPKPFVVFPAAPAAPTVNAGCGAITVTPPPAVAGFTTQYSFDNGTTWGDNNPPTASNCLGYNIKTRYVLTAACGTTAALATAPSSCIESSATNRKIDLVAPTIDPAPADETVACGVSPLAAAVLSATDNCDATYPKDAVMTETSVVSGCQTVITRKWNTTDACTNAATERTQTITVNADADAPVIAAAPAAVTVACGGTVPAAAVLSATDNCDATYPKDAVMTETSVVSGCQTVITRKWNTTDACTNAATERVQVITVFPDPANFTVSATPGACSGTAKVVCGGATITMVTATSTAPGPACPAATGPATTAPLSYVVNPGSPCATTLSGTATATGCAGPQEAGCVLSVKWLYFDGTAYTGYNMLNWATANEVNNYFFEVQRSKNGVDFENIGRVNGSGTTNETKTYTYKDATPIAGLNIYRLRQIDFDGKFSTSNSVSLYNKMDKFKMLDAYPNPTKLDINVKLFAPTQGNAQIVVRDVAGKVVYTHNQMTASGVNLLTIDASNFAEGMYMILAIDAKTGASSTIKFIKD